MTDVAPALLDALEDRFRALYDSNRPLRDVFGRVEAGTATYADAAKYAELVSRDLTTACAAVLKDEALPDGRMYYNIADRVLRPVIGEQTELIANVCERTQTALNQAAGIGMKAVRVEPDADRIQGIVDEASNAERFSDVAERVYSHIDNLGRHTVDESVRQNADAQWKAGMAPKVHRTGATGCCQWCADLAGTYDYGEVHEKGSEVWRRHANCGCLIEYDPGNGRREAVSNYRWSGHYESEGQGATRHAVWKADMSDEEIAKRIGESRALTRDNDPARIETRKMAAARASAAVNDRIGPRSVIYDDDRQGNRVMPETLFLPDETIGRSVGAKAANYDILDLQTGERYHLAEGSRLQDVKVFAGKGTRTAFRDAEKYADRYGGAAEDWQHAKGVGTLETPDGERHAELHWVQCEGLGKREMFVKEWLDEG